MHTGNRKLSFMASERREIKVMLSQIINPTFCRTAQADLNVW